MEGLQRSVANHSQCETEVRMAVEISSTLVFISSPSMSGAALPPRSTSLIISDVMLIVTSVP